jgi:hypothetical protein
LDEAVQVDECLSGSRRKRRRREGGLGESSNASSSSSIFGLSRAAIPGDSDIGSPERACEEQGLAVVPLNFPQTVAPLGARSKSRLKSRWYTSMLGKLSSVAEVVGVIREHKVSGQGSFDVPRWILHFAPSALSSFPTNNARLSRLRIMLSQNSYKGKLDDGL